MTRNSDPQRRIVLDRNWRQGDAKKLSEPPCNLQRKLPCCQGKGYLVQAEGALAHASVCACVKGCPACLGQARAYIGNDSKPCQSPAPNVVVNLINAAMVPARYAEASLEKFRNFSGNGRQVLQELLRWRARFSPSKGPGLVLEGPVGVGKTFLLASLAKEFAERGWTVRFTDFFQLLGELKAGFAQGKADAAQLAPLIDVDVLFIDELGKGRNNDFELTVLDQLVCGRYNQNKPIIATTNYKLKGRGYDVNMALDSHPESAGHGLFAESRFSTLEQRIGTRIFSRLKEMTQFIELTGDDWRRREAY